MLKGKFMSVLLNAGYFSRTSNFRGFRGFRKIMKISSRKNLSPRKKTSVKKRTDQYNFQKKKDKDFSPQCVWLCLRAW